jgi:hypothetical protein
MTLTLEDALAHAVSWHMVYPNSWQKPKGSGGWYGAKKSKDDGSLEIFTDKSFATYDEAFVHALKHIVKF